MKIGDLVEFTYGRVAGQINGIGIFMEEGKSGKHKILFPSHDRGGLNCFRQFDIGWLPVS